MSPEEIVQRLRLSATQILPEIRQKLDNLQKDVDSLKNLLETANELAQHTKEIE